MVRIVERIERLGIIAEDEMGVMHQARCRLLGEFRDADARIAAILVVAQDDDPDIRLVNQRLLMGEGAQSCPATAAPGCDLPGA